MRALLAGLLAGWAGAVPAQDFTTLKGHGGPIMDIAVAPSGQVVTASFDNSVGLWDGRMPVWLEGHAAAVVALAFTPDGTVLSGGDDFAVRLWQDGSARVIGQHRGKVSSLAAGAGVIASGSWDGTIGLWSPDEGALGALRGHEQGVNDVALSEDGATLWSASADGTIRLWDVATQAERQRVVNHGFGINQLIVTTAWIAYGAVDGGTRVIDHQGQEIADFTLDRRPILAMDWHAGTGTLAVGDGQGYIMIVDTKDWQITRDFRATRDGPVWALAFGPEGRMIYAGGIDDVAYGWPVASLDSYAPGISGERSFLRDTGEMDNGERQFMRKCSICHALDSGPSRKAGPTLYGVFGRRAGTVPGYPYSDTLDGADITWGAATIDALFDEGPDHYIPGSKMPMQVIAGAGDRADLIAFLKTATAEEVTE